MANNHPTSTPKLTRRGFLGASAAAAVAPYIVPSTVFGATAPSNRITLGFVGLGNQGMHVMWNFLQHKDCQGVAVCDVNRESGNYKRVDQVCGREPARRTVDEHYAKQSPSGSYKGCAAYNDFREMLARDDLDAVVIATPDHWHGVMTVLAAEAGKDIYCEKPLSLTVRQGRMMADAVERHGRVLQCGSHQRSDPVTRLVCELARNGYVGDIKSIETHVGGVDLSPDPGPGWEPMPIPEGFDYDLWLGPAPAAPYHLARCLYRYRFNYDYSGGQVTNWGAHSLDMAQWALGRDDSGPEAVEYVEADLPPAGSVYNVATRSVFHLHYPGGIKVVSKTADPAAFIAIEGTEGKVAAGRGIKSLRTEPASLAGVQLSEDQVLSTSTDHLQDFLDCVKSRGVPAASVEVGHRSATACHLGNIAIRLRDTLAWDAAAERFTGRRSEEANALLSRDLRDPWDEALGLS